MVSEKERKNREKLFRLMKENPELPVVPMVDSAIIADNGYAYWKGSFGETCVSEYLVGDTKLHFKKDDDSSEVDDALYDFLNAEDYESIKTDTDAIRAYAELPWIKAIIVYIELPEV